MLYVTENLCIDRAAEVARLLAAEIESGETLSLDLSGVSRIDLAGIQLLYAVTRQCEIVEKPIQFRGTVAADVSEAIVAAGFAPAPADDWDALARSMYDLGVSS